MNEQSVVLLLGSNDLEAEEIVHKALSIIDIAVGRVVKRSQSHRSKAYGFTSDREFVNEAVEITTTLDAYEVLRRINLIEALLGRDREVERSEREQRNEAYASRPIDIDIIFYDDYVCESERLTLPHKLMHLRDFVLRPLCEVAPDWRHPKLGKSVEEMMK